VKVFSYFCQSSRDITNLDIEDLKQQRVKDPSTTVVVNE